MSNIRSYMKKKEERESSRRELKKKIRQHRLSIFYRTLLVIILIAALAGVAYEQYKNKIYTGYRVLTSASWEQIPGTGCKALGNSVLIYSKDGVHCIDAKGSKLWDETYEMQNPKLSVCKDVAAVGDYNGRTIYVVSATSILGEIKTNLPIKDFCVAQNGVVAAILEDSEVSWIYLYDKSGEELVCFKTTMKNSGYPIAISMSPNAELFAVSYLYVDRGLLRTSVSFYNFGAVGQNYTDRYVSGYDYNDCIVPKVQFMTDKTIYAVADNRLMFYGGAQIPTSTTEILFNEEIRSVFSGENYVELVFHDTTGEHKYKLEVYNDAGELKFSQGFDVEYTNILVEDKNIIIYNDTECQIFNMEGVEKYAGSFNKPISLMKTLSTPYRYVLVTADSIETVELE